MEPDKFPPQLALDQYSLACEKGYAVDEVVVVRAPHPKGGFEYAWWDWKKAPGKGALFQEMRRPKSWFIMQISYPNPLDKTKARFDCSYYSTEPIN